MDNTLQRLRNEIELEHAKVSGDDGYNYAAGQEYGLRLALNKIDEAIAAISRAPGAVAPPFRFRRFVDGGEMAEDVEISNASTVEQAFFKARALYGNPKGMDLLLTAATPPAPQPALALIEDDTPSDAEVEAAAKAIARIVPIDGSSLWHAAHGHNFPQEYSEKEQRLIRSIARTALTSAKRFKGE